MQEDIKKSLEVLRNGGVILYPTDTIWGLGCDATNPIAVKRIFEIKKRSDTKSLIVLIDHAARLSAYVEDIPDVAYDLLEVAEKPLTLILENAKNLAENVINTSDRSVGIRIPDDAFCQRLIQQFKKPIVSTSANIAGQSAPQNFDQINDEIIQAADYVVQYRQDDIAKAYPSSIIKIGAGGQVKIIRE